MLLSWCFVPLLFILNKIINYIPADTNAIPGELSREKHDIIFTREDNVLSSHMKRSPLLPLHNKLCLSHQKLKAFIGISLMVIIIIDRILHGHLGVGNFSSSDKKYFTGSLCSL